MKIQVTAEDIVKGKRESCDSCPIALAITRKAGERASVDECTAWFISTESLIPLPVSARKFVRAFDRGDSVAPFEFDLDRAREDS